MAESKGFFRRTPVRLRVTSLLDHVGKNSPPDCFLPQTSSAPSLFESLFLFCQSKKQASRPAFHFGGELGIRTLGTLRTQHFECCTFDHSDNSPRRDSLFSRYLFIIRLTDEFCQAKSFFFLFLSPIRRLKFNRIFAIMLVDSI